MADDDVVTPEKFNLYLADLYKDAQTGRVLTICALLEDVLKTSIKSKMVMLSSDIESRIFGGTGPIQNISAKIDVAFALGLLSQEMRKKLHLVRKIRNGFAHTSQRINFETEHIIVLCKLIKPDLEPKEAEGIFFSTAVSIMKHLLFVAQYNPINISSLGTSKGIGLLGLYHHPTDSDQSQKDEPPPPESSQE